MKLGFIGCGNMATAIIKGILSKDLVPKSAVYASNSTVEHADATRAALGVTTTTDNRYVVKNSDVVFLSVKPQHYAHVIEEVREFVREDHIVVTIAPGKTIAWLEEQFAKPVKIVRSMPNTPALVGEGLTSYCPNALVEDAELARIESLLGSYGKITRLPEHLIDAASAVGGSAPAWTYMFIEALADGGVAEGLPRAAAYEIAAQTVLGSAKMVLETGKHPAQLKDEVCSPGGSTIAGVETLEQNAFRGTVMGAVRSCAAKARSL